MDYQTEHIFIRRKGEKKFRPPVPETPRICAQRYKSRCLSCLILTSAARLTERWRTSRIRGTARKWYSGIRTAAVSHRCWSRSSRRRSCGRSPVFRIRPLPCHFRTCPTCSLEVQTRQRERERICEKSPSNEMVECKSHTRGNLRTCIIIPLHDALRARNVRW